MGRVSKQYDLQWIDAGKGLLIAVVSAVLSFVVESLNKGELTLNWKSLAATAISAGFAYILKNFFEPTRVITKQ